MKLGLVISITLALSCAMPKPPPRPEPKINIETDEDTSSNKLKIYYVNHQLPQNSWSYVELATLEELQAYKKQVQFLLKRLEETEEKMNSHAFEPEATIH